MNTCFNHPDKKAFSICHGCGKSYCKSCLDEGIEYYYCKDPECQKLLKDEIWLQEDDVTCPNCGSKLDPSRKEIETKKVHCPKCETFIDFNFKPPKVFKKDNYVEFLSSLNIGDISIIKSLLDRGAIDYYVFGETFLNLYPSLEPARLFVNENQIEEVKEILKDFDLHIWGLSSNR